MKAICKKFLFGMTMSAAQTDMSLLDCVSFKLQLLVRKKSLFAWEERVGNTLDTCGGVWMD